MTEPHQPTDDTKATDALLGRARTLILGLIDAVRREIAGRPPGLAAKLCRQLLRDYIEPAEAALRRAIFIIAATVTAPAPSAPTRRPEPPAPSLRAPARRAEVIAPRPVFRLTEPVPGETRAGPAVKPAGNILPASRRPADPSIAQDKLLRRLEALTTAAENPVREATRWLRRRARETGNKPAHRRQRPFPIDYFGLPARFARLPYGIRDLIWHLNDIAFFVLAEDTS